MNKISTGKLQVLWLGLSKISYFAGTLLSASILSHYLTKTDYGTYRQVIFVYITLLTFFSVGLPSAYGYFLPKLDKNQASNFILKQFKLLIILGLFFSIVLFFGATIIAKILRNNALLEAISYFSVIPLLTLPILGLDEIFAVLKKTHIIAIYSLITRVLSFVFIVLPVIYLRQDYIFAIYGWILSSIISLILGIIILLKYFDGNWRVESISYKTILQFSTPIMFASISSILIKAADSFLISRYFGSSVYADYINGFLELPLVGIFASSIATVILPLLVIEKSNKNALIIQMLKKVIEKTMIAIYPFIIFAIIFSKNIITIIYGSNYISSAYYFKLAMIINFFNIIYLSPYLLALGKNKVFANVHIFIAVGVWLFEYLAISLFRSPIIVAYISMSFAILKIIILLKLLVSYLNIPFSNIIPFNLFFRIVFHTTLTVFIIFYLQDYIINVPQLLKISFCFFFYATFLFITQKYFGINYLTVLKNNILKEI